MNLNKISARFDPPSPQERRANIAAIKWGLFDLFEYEPHTAQMDFHLSDARFRMSIAGTRGGKSRSAGEEVVPYLFAGATRVWLVGQKYADCAKEFDYVDQRMVSEQVRDMFGGTLPIKHRVYNEKQGNMYIETKWGSWVKCISLDKSDPFGEEVDLIVMCEGAQIKKPKILYQRVLRGRLASRMGDLIIPTTPAGKNTVRDPDDWLLEMYERGLDPEYEDYFTREWPSWENHKFPEDPYELRAEIDPRIFAEQYEGKFVVFTGAVYNKYNPDINVIKPFKIPRHWRRVEAIDPGFSGQFAWTSAVISEVGNVYIVDEYTDQERLYEERVKIIKDHRCEQYNIPHGLWDVFASKNNIKTITYVDPEDPQCRAEFLNLNLPCLPAHNDIPVGIDRVQRRLAGYRGYAPSLYITNNCSKTMSALEKHSWGLKTTSLNTGVNNTRKPANDAHKHLADTVRYICNGNLTPSDPVEEMPSDQESMYEIMNDLIASGQMPNHADMTAYDRRRMAGVV